MPSKFGNQIFSAPGLYLICALESLKKKVTKPKCVHRHCHYKLFGEEDTQNHGNRQITMQERCLRGAIWVTNGVDNRECSSFLSLSLLSLSFGSLLFHSSSFLRRFVLPPSCLFIRFLRLLLAYIRARCACLAFFVCFIMP